MKFQQTITLSTFSVALLFQACNGEKNPTSSSRTLSGEKPNIVLLVSDDHGRGDLGCYGNKYIKTPHLDALAEGGIRMSNAYCTSASCSASRSVILSGIYNHANGQFGHTHHYHHFSAFPGIKSLPVILSENGYNTTRAGKFHVAPEEVFAFDNVINYSGRNAVEMATLCEDYILNSKDPFFLYFCTFDPHRSGEYAENIPGNPNRFGNKEEGFPGVETKLFSPDSVLVPSYLPDTPECRAELAQYYQSVYRMDQGFGRILEYLKKSGRYDNTLIIYISDNGIAFPGAKTTQYDPGIHLPCIVKYPNCEFPGTVNNAMVTWADIVPTVLDFAGLLPDDNSIPLTEDYADYNGYSQPFYKTFQGTSFKQALLDPGSECRDEIFTSHTFHEITMYYPMRTYQDRNYKLIWNIAYPLAYPHASDLWESPTWQSVLNSGSGVYAGKKISDFTYRKEFELYDMQNDPDELVNLAYEKKYQEVLSSMKQKLKEYQEKTLDPWAVKWDHE